MLISSFLIALGLVLLVLGGDALVRGSVAIAVRSSVPRALVGSTLVAAGTSMPEFVVSVTAALDGAPDVSVGNVVGSNIYNVLLVLGLALVFRACTAGPTSARLEAPAMVAASIALLGLGWDGEISRLDGGLLLAGGVLFVVENVRRAMQHRAPDDQAVDSWPIALLAVGLGVALLIGGARALVTGAVDIASGLGVTERVIGLTVVAIGTSLPELFASVAAARRGEGGIAIGNVVGSNVFNILAILGPVAMLHPLAVNPVMITSDLPWALGVAAALAARLLWSPTLGRGVGVGLLATGAVYTALLIVSIEPGSTARPPTPAPVVTGVPTTDDTDPLAFTGLPGTPIPASARPAASPELLVARRSWPLGKGTLTQIAPPRGRWLLYEEDGVVAHLEATAEVEMEPDGLYVGGEYCDLTGLPTSPSPWVPICPQVWRRVPTEGRKTRLEWGSDLVRDHIVGGEALTEVVKSQVVGDKYRQPATRLEALEEAVQPGTPAALTVTDRTALGTPQLGLPISGSPERLTAGRFYPVDRAPGVHLAAVTPELMGVTELQPYEADATVLMVAFDLSAFTLDYHLGTEHPRLGFADKIPSARRNGQKGPDGFDDAGPLQRTGQVGPDDLAFAVAAFTAGFKRSHGAFHRGALAKAEFNSHYGFIEEGVPFSKLQPGLATLSIDWDGVVDLRTWTEQDDARLPDIRFARQNGAPLVQLDPAGAPMLGPYATNLADGNWSGSVEGNARSLRAGACIRPGDGRQDLVFGYFTSVTPGTMARTFLAAGCTTAMLLDMNALEHTYLAVYTRSDDGMLRTHNLDTGMAVLDRTRKDGTVMPRFLAFADNRDFFVVRPRGK